jgi:hypothetical protein
MKKIKLLLLVVFSSTLSFIACTDDSNNVAAPQTTVSPSLRIALNSMVSRFIPAAKFALATNDEVSDDNVAELCFDFVYPITLSYNDGTTVTVNALDEIMELLQNETNDSYLNGIAFPFQIDYFAEGVIIIVESETDFEALNLSCGDSYYEDGDMIENECFEFQFPFSLLTANNDVIEITSLVALYNLFDNQDPEVIDFVYPLNILVNNEVVVINNMFEFSEVLNNCYGSSEPSPGDGNDDFDCICTTDYNPVCVVLENGQMITFTNACLANCAGFDDSTFVPCE